MKKYILILMAVFVVGANAGEVEPYTVEWLEKGIRDSIKIDSGKNVAEQDIIRSLLTQGWIFGYLQGMSDSGKWDGYEKLIADKGMQAVYASVLDYLSKNPTPPNTYAADVLKSWYAAKYLKH